MTRCKYLTADDRCGIYLNRPKICREYTTDECEYDDDWSSRRSSRRPSRSGNTPRPSCRPGAAAAAEPGAADRDGHRLESRPEH